MKYEFDVLTINWNEFQNMSAMLNERGKDGWHVIDVYDSSIREYESSQHITPKRDDNYKNFILQRQINSQ